MTERRNARERRGVQLPGEPQVSDIQGCLKFWVCSELGDLTWFHRAFIQVTREEECLSWAGKWTAGDVLSSGNVGHEELGPRSEGQRMVQARLSLGRRNRVLSSLLECKPLTTVATASGSLFVPPGSPLSVGTHCLCCSCNGLNKRSKEQNK